MQRKLLQLMLIMIIIVLAGIFMIKLTGKDNDIETMKDEDKITVVTTIYPIYLIGINLAEDIDNLQIVSLINRNTGCLHDYQLTAEDMKVISAADVLIINGGGMEAFLKDIAVNYPDLKIIDASRDLDMMESLDFRVDEASWGDTYQESDEGDYNSHVWLDPLLYEKQIENVQNSLIDYIHTAFSNTGIEINDITDKLTENAQAYIDQVQQLEIELEKCKNELEKASANTKKAVIFHEAFAYLANRLDMPVAFSVELEADTSLSAGNIAAIVEEINAGKIKYLFTEEQYSEAIPKQIAKETGARVYVIDSVVTGDGTKDSYLRAMRSNLEVIKDAQKEEG